MKIKLVPVILLFSGLCADTPNLFLSEILASNSTINLDPDFFAFSDWIEIYNSEDTAVNLSEYYLTDDLNNPFKFQFVNNSIIEPHSYFIVWADGKNIYPGMHHPSYPSYIDKSIISHHTNFKLSKGGEEIGLFNSSGNLVDVISYNEQITDISYGTTSVGSIDLNYFYLPSPGDSSISTGFEDTIRVPGPEFSLSGGIYASMQNLELITSNISDTIRYTIDGSKPTIDSEIYNNSIIIDSTTIIRAQVFHNNILPSIIKTETYIIGEQHTLPVISIATDSIYFWDEEIGIHLVGSNGNFGCDGTWSNYNQDWERPINFEYFTPNGELGFKINAGIKIFGGCSREHAQKSLAIYTKKYDTEIINYQIFEDKPINEFKSFLLRNSGSDWSHTEYYLGTMLRDALMQSLVSNQMDIDYQSYQPATIYFNGMYWGILNIREKLNGDYLASNHNVDSDNVDILKRNVTVYAGDSNHFYSLLNFIETNGTALDSNYNYIKTQIDLYEYINYQISEIYFANQDWPGNNIKYWRPRIDNGKWRWILTDTDAGFSLLDPNDFSHNTLENASMWNGDANCIFLQNCGENDNMEKYLFNKLLEQDEFQDEFINRLAYYLNTTFQTGRVINIIDSLSNKINQEMYKHFDRWGDFITMNNWEDNLNVLREFANQRPSIVQQHIIDHFNLNGLSELVINISESEAGNIEINNFFIPTFPDTGEYFQGIFIPLKAIPNEGYNFIGWQGMSNEITNFDSISISLQGDTSITAIFEQIILPPELTDIDNQEIEEDDNINITIQCYSPMNLALTYSAESDTSDIILSLGDSTLTATPSPDWSGTGVIALIVTDENELSDTTSFQLTVIPVNDAPQSFNLIYPMASDTIEISTDTDETITFNWEESVDIDSEVNYIITLILDYFGETYMDTYESNEPIAEVIPYEWAALMTNLNLGLWTLQYNVEASDEEYNTVSEGEFVFHNTSLSVDGDITPLSFRLHQNYPNPFNPITTLQYDLPEDSFVNITIYDMLGNVVNNLVNANQSSGYKSVQWNSTNNQGQPVSAGLYLYMIEAGQFRQTKKMVLLK